VGKFVADFAAPFCRLIVEVDGGYHVTRKQADASRDDKLRRLGWRVLRIPAETVLHRLPDAVAAIQAQIAASAP
jgi:very-short-patch-repair endonuclease